MKHFVPPAATLVFAFSSLVLPCSAFQGTRVIRPELGQGLASSWPAGVSIRGAADPLLVRAAGTASGVPSVWSATAYGATSSVHPDYSITALTANWGLPTTAPMPTFGGISTGGELMPSVDANGALSMAVGDWFAISVSVSGSAGGKAGSMVELLRGNGTRNPGGDVFSYYAIGSDRIHDDLVDTVRLEQSREQLQLTQVTTTPDEAREITNLDFGIGMISIDPQNQAGPMFEVRDQFYFTLTKAWCAALNQPPSMYYIDGAPPNASTVYVMTWSTTSSPPWSEPSVAYTHSQLFGTFTGVDVGDVEIDALSVDQGDGASSRVVFSLTPESDFALTTGYFDQILVYQIDADPTLSVSTRPLKTDPAAGTSQAISGHLGLRTRIEGEPDNITSTCLLDPDEGYNIRPIVGLATNQLACREGLLGLSAFRQDQPQLQDDELHLQVSGLGLGTFDLGLVVLFTEGDALPPNSPLEPAKATQWGEPWVIDSTTAKYNAFELSIPIPDSIAGTTFRCSARYLGVRLNPFQVVPLRESWVLGIRN